MGTPTNELADGNSNLPLVDNCTVMNLPQTSNSKAGKDNKNSDIMAMIAQKANQWDLEALT